MAGARMYMGVEEVIGTELFYYFVESERSPGADPRSSGSPAGPRCPSYNAYAFEVG